MFGLGRLGRLGAKGQVLASSAPVPFGTLSTVFDGTNEFLNRTHSASHNFTTQLTIVYWCKAAASGGDSGIVNKGQYDAANKSYYLSKGSADPSLLTLQISKDGSASALKTSSVAFHTSAWVHACVTYNAGTVKMYKNGVEDTGATGNTSAIDTLFGNTTNGLDVGCLRSTAGAEFFYGGRLLNLGLFKVTFSQAEVTEAYNGGITFDLRNHSQYTTNCRSFYRLGDGDAVATGFIDLKTALTLSATNMEAGDISADVP